MTGGTAPAEGTLEAALSHHQAGRLDEAKRLYSDILSQEPEHAVALHLRGVIAYQEGDLGRAVELIGRAIALRPGYAGAHNNLGIALHDQGKLDEAAAAYRKTLGLKPDHAEAHNNLGVTLKGQGKLGEAVAAHRKALELKPDYADVHYNLGIALHAQGKLKAAISAFREALELKPGYAEAYYNLGIALNDQGTLDEAVAAYHEAVAQKPDYAEAHNNLGNALKDQGKLDQAVAAFRKSLELKPNTSETHSNLGNALNSLGKMAEAVASYRQALAIKPDNAEAHRHLAGVETRSEYDNDIKAMEAAYGAPGLGDQARMHLAFGLGKSFEDLRQYEKAFGFFVTGNAIKRGTYEFSMESIEGYFECLMNLFTPDLFGKHQAAGSSDETPIFVLGMPRSGTILVEQILASHPNVHGAGELACLNRIVTSNFRGVDDPHFTGSISQASIGDFSSAGGEYIAMIRERADAERFITDKMPENFRLIGMIKLLLPKAKIIHCCRDPLDTCLSIFKNYFSGGGISYAYNLGELGQYYNLYSELMAHWGTVLPDFIYDIHYEDLVADQESQSRALVAHCGLEWDDACLEFHKTDRPIRTASNVQVRRPIYQDSVRSWKHYEDWLAPLRVVLANRQ